MNISEYVGQASTTLPKKDLGPSIAPYCPMCPLVPMMLSKLMVANVSFNPHPTPSLTRQSTANQSQREFPANRENNREFYKNWAVWRNCTRQNAAESVSCKIIPYKMKQGINSRRTGNLLSRAGNLQRLAGNCRPCAGILARFEPPPSLGRAATRTRRHRMRGRRAEQGIY